MRDAAMLALIVIFLWLCVGYVAWCDHIVGYDAETRRGIVDAGTEVEDGAPR